MPSINNDSLLRHLVERRHASKQQLSKWECVKQTLYDLLIAIKDFVIKIKNKLLGIREEPPSLDEEATTLDEEATTLDEEATTLDDPVSQQEITIVEEPKPKELSDKQIQQLDEAKAKDATIHATLHTIINRVLQYNHNPAFQAVSPPKFDMSIIADLLQQIPQLVNEIPQHLDTLTWLTNNTPNEQLQKKLAAIFPTNDPVINQRCLTLFHALETAICCHRLTACRRDDINNSHRMQDLSTEISGLSQKLTDIFATKEHASDIASLIKEHTDDIKQLTKMKAELEQIKYKLAAIHDKMFVYHTAIIALTYRSVSAPLQHLLPTIEADLGPHQQHPALMQRIRERARARHEPNPRLGHCVQQREKVSDLFFAMYRMKDLPQENLLDNAQEAMNNLMNQALDDVRIDKLYDKLATSPEGEDFAWEHGLKELHNMYEAHTTILYKEIEQLMQNANIKDEVIKTVLGELPSNTFPFTRAEFKTFPENMKWRGNIFMGLGLTQEEIYEAANKKARIHCSGLIDYTLKHFETAPLSAWQEKSFQEHLKRSLNGVLLEWHEKHINDNGHLDAASQQYLSEILYGIEENRPEPYQRYTHKLLETKSLCTELAQIQVNINTCKQNIKETETKIAELHKNIREAIKNKKPDQLVDYAFHLHTLQKQLHALHETKTKYEVRKNVHKSALEHIKNTGIRDSISRDHNAIQDVLSDDQHKELTKDFSNTPISPNIIPPKPQANAMLDLCHLCLNISDPNSPTIKEKQKFAFIMKTLWKVLPRDHGLTKPSDNLDKATEFLHKKLSALYPPFVQQLDQCISDVFNNKQTDKSTILSDTMKKPFWNKTLIRDILDTESKENSSEPNK